MTPTVKDARARNLHFLSWQHFGQDRLVEKCRAVGNQTELSNLITGKKSCSDGQARRIERELRLPDSWLDRDNIGLTAIDANDFEVVQKLLGADPKLKAAICAVLDAV